MNQLVSLGIYVALQAAIKFWNEDHGYLLR
jgi:hypothetical protein